jgi:hypothetical protein
MAGVVVGDHRGVRIGAVRISFRRDVAWRQAALLQAAEGRMVLDLAGGSGGQRRQVLMGCCFWRSRVSRETTMPGIGGVGEAGARLSAGRAVSRVRVGASLRNVWRGSMVAVSVIWRRREWLAVGAWRSKRMAQMAV